MEQSGIKVLSPEQAHNIVSAEQEKCVLLDVRTPAEYASRRAVSAVNIPLHSIMNASSSSEFQQLKDKQIICICEKGVRAQKAAELLQRHGFMTVANVEGGTEAWASSGLPLIKGQSAMSLERQVRIVAGSLVVLGVLGSYFINPYVSLLSLFVGCGLVFSGLTNTCGMALVLARCPWNKS